MTRFFSLMLALFLILGLLASAWAADGIANASPISLNNSANYNFTVYLESAQTDIASGDTLSVDIMLAGDINYTQVSASITYDAGLLQYAGYADLSGVAAEIRQDGAGKISLRSVPSLNMMLGAPCAPPLRVVTLKFTVKDSITEKKVDSGLDFAAINVFPTAGVKALIAPGEPIAFTLWRKADKVADVAFAYFLEIIKIPRGTDNEQEISDYLMAFAAENGLQAVQDYALNVLITKAGSPGRENEPSIILQAHMDMVCVKSDDSDHDFLTDPIIPIIDGDWITADSTSLGADNGGGLAIILAVLAAKNLSHPPIEAIITAAEEGGAGDGVYGFDFSQLKGNRIINMDSEEEGEFTVSCAGTAGSFADISGEYQAIADGSTTYQLTVKGLTGGHSALDIDKGRANANLLMARLLRALDDGKIFLSSIDGGSAFNAIPTECVAEISFDASNVEMIQSTVTQMETAFKTEYPAENIVLTLEKTDTAQNVLSRELLRKVIDCILNTPNGVKTMSGDIAGLVQTSGNLSFVSTYYEYPEAGDVTVFLDRMLRGSDMDDLYLLLEELDAKSIEAGASFSDGGVFGSPWEFKADSPLRDTLISIYEDIYGETPIITGTHGFLECAIFAEVMPDCDIISIGPNIEGAHSTSERMSISSFARTCIYLISILERL